MEEVELSKRLQKGSCPSRWGVFQQTPRGKNFEVHPVGSLSPFFSRYSKFFGVGLGKIFVGEAVVLTASPFQRSAERSAVARGNLPSEVSPLFHFGLQLSHTRTDLGTGEAW